VKEILMTWLFPTSILTFLKPNNHPITLQHQEILTSAAPLTGSFVSQKKEAM
jgi:hypothetical protein